MLIYPIYQRRMPFVKPEVLTLNMVDNSTNPRKGMSGWFFSSFSFPGGTLPLSGG